ncbi:hypothetical protein DAPPUDRAFT_245739 [Daphnia pulex]|uniref:Uncharacterized protein n=1 Tax=Daphnia pulex TaxID=6669 RepID=E9GNZ0_DAPPU|nr:hypothetical protein DAPPUDRAFT_245739 [Daphnia pulex]|eukprot:EFX78833.1 hypothetical protein DAPPUDRAFT_245739 [Daphnia pulex]
MLAIAKKEIYCNTAPASDRTVNPALPPKALDAGKHFQRLLYSWFSIVHSVESENHSNINRPRCWPVGVSPDMALSIQQQPLNAQSTTDFHSQQTRPGSRRTMHKRIRRPPVTVLSSTRTESTCIFHRRYRLNVRRKLLRAIVLGSDDNPTHLRDNELAARLEEALLDPLPRPHTDVARIWLRYSFHVADYFQSDRLAAIQPSLLERVSEGGRLLVLPRCRTLWEDCLESDIRKSYNRYVKTAALDFILSDGSSLSWTCKRDQPILMARSCPRQTDRHKPMLAVQRSLGRKLCIHHFYGRKFVALWYKFIRPMQWQKCSRLRKDHWEIGELKISWEKEMATAEQLLVDGWQTIVKSVVKYALRKKLALPSDGNVQLICRTLDTLIGLLLQEWRQENMTNFGLWLNNRQDVKNQLVFVIHVSMNDGQLKFDPPVQEISLAWGQFCDLLSVAAYRSLQSSRLVFETIRKQMNNSDPAQQPEPIHSIKVKTPAEFLDHIRRVIADAFADDNVMLTRALEKFLVFSSFLKEDSEELENLDQEGVDFDLLQERVQHYRQVLKRIETDLPCTLPVGQSLPGPDGRTQVVPQEQNRLNHRSTAGPVQQEFHLIGHQVSK